MYKVVFNESNELDLKKEKRSDEEIVIFSATCLTRLFPEVSITEALCEEKVSRSGRLYICTWHYKQDDTAKKVYIQIEDNVLDLEMYRATHNYEDFEALEVQSRIDDEMMEESEIKQMINEQEAELYHRCGTFIYDKLNPKRCKQKV